MTPKPQSQKTIDEQTAQLTPEDRDRFGRVCTHFTKVTDASCEVDRVYTETVMPLCCVLGVHPEFCGAYEAPETDLDILNRKRHLEMKAAAIVLATEHGECPRCKGSNLKDRRARFGPQRGRGVVECRDCGMRTKV